VTDAVEWSGHAKEMCRERGIYPEWVNVALGQPDAVFEACDGWHYLKRIAQRQDRVLRLVTSAIIGGPVRAKLTTVFFDRRARNLGPRNG